MESPKPDPRRASQINLSRQQIMNIQSYVDLVDQLLDDKHFTPELKKPPRRAPSY
jgi:hypothetical protein